MRLGPQPVEGLAEKGQENRRLGAAEFRERRILLFPGDCLTQHFSNAVESRGPLLARGGDHFVDGQRLLFGFCHRFRPGTLWACDSLQFSFRLNPMDFQHLRLSGRKNYFGANLSLTFKLPSRIICVSDMRLEGRCTPSFEVVGSSTG